MDEEKIPAELKLRLLEAEKEINESIPQRFNWKRGAMVAAFTCIAFFLFGIFFAPIGSAIGFAICGAITGLLVGATHKPKRYDR